MPIRILSMTHLHLISPSIQLLINHQEVSRPISQEWTSSLNSNSQTHLTHSVTQRTLCNQKQATFPLRVIRNMLSLFVANWPHMLLLMWGVSFAFTFSVYLYAKNMRGSFIGIAMVRLLPGALTISRNPISFLASFGITNHLQQGHDTSVLCATPADIQQISLFECCLRDENPAHREFRVIMVLDHDNPKIEKKFIISFPPKYTAHSLFG
jgi:hypothetical protein